MKTEAFQEKLDALVRTLMEHCDSVRLFVTVRDGDSTRGMTFGGGNYFAQYGQVLEWTRYQEAGVACKAAEDAFEMEDDDDEEELPEPVD